MEQEDIANALGDEIAYWRRRRGLTRDELGAIVGTSGNTVGRWERGDTTPDVPQTWATANALRIDLTTLIERAETSARLGSRDREAPEMKDLRERAYAHSAVDVLETLSDIKMQAAVAQVIARRCRAVPVPERRTTWQALAEALPGLDRASKAGTVTPADVRTIADSLDGDDGIYVGDFVVALRRMVDRRQSANVEGPDPSHYSLAANDPGVPSQGERVRQAQDDAYEIDQDADSDSQ